MYDEEKIEQIVRRKELLSDDQVEKVREAGRRTKTAICCHCHRGGDPFAPHHPVCYLQSELNPAEQHGRTLFASRRK
jgi:hypothetical protein